MFDELDLKRLIDELEFADHLVRKWWQKHPRFVPHFFGPDCKIYPPLPSHVDFFCLASVDAMAPRFKDGKVKELVVTGAWRLYNSHHAYMVLVPAYYHPHIMPAVTGKWVREKYLQNTIVIKDCFKKTSDISVVREPDWLEVIIPYPIDFAEDEPKEVKCNTVKHLLGKKVPGTNPITPNEFKVYYFE